MYLCGNESRTGKNNTHTAVRNASVPVFGAVSAGFPRWWKKPKEDMKNVSYLDQATA